MNSAKIEDVICGMHVDPAKAAWTSAFGGRTYYFCSKSCKAGFDAGPARYVPMTFAHWPSGTHPTIRTSARPGPL
jgi:P-type Cu+ transporter